MRKRPSKRRIWARFVRGDWVEEQDWWRYKLYKRNDGKPIVFNVYTFKYKRPAKDIGGQVMTKIYHELHPDNIAILRNPTAEGAMRQLKKLVGFEPSSPRVALAAVHKARLSWSGSTSEMIEESKRGE